MLRTIEYEEVLKGFNKPYVFIDVRSPREFEEATIPGSINIPLFSDLEREEIGTVYVKESHEKAKKLGIEIVSRKLPIIYDEFRKIDESNKISIIFCARGGMRSSSIASLLEAIGMKVYKLYSGYKGYRAYINGCLPKVFEEIKFVVLYGNTGTAKTHLLHKLKEKGYDILDIEGCANHRGSLLGSVGLGDQNSQKMFESLVFDQLKNRKRNVVFTEGESKRIGKIIMTDSMYNSIQSGKNVLVNAPISSRVNNIKNDYITNSESLNEIVEALTRMKKYISESRIENYINNIKKGEIDLVIEDLMIKYYDPMYNHKNISYDFNLENINLDKASDELIERFIWICLDGQRDSFCLLNLFLYIFIS